MTPSRLRRQRLARKRLAQQSSKRQLHHETLERRELLAAEIESFDAALHEDPQVRPVFAPGTKQDIIDAWGNPFGGLTDDDGLSSPVNLSSTRWTNPTGGPSPNRGDGATITWSIVPDGTDVAGGATGPSDLVAFMDGIYGDGGATTIADRPWFRLYEEVYESWSTLTGIEFIYEPNDDGAPQGGGNRGVLGVRGDVRIAGAFIDGTQAYSRTTSFRITEATVGPTVIWSSTRRTTSMLIAPTLPPARTARW